jgi:hypothetical protein
VRYRLMATYRGSPFEAGIGPTDDDIVLFAACPPPEELGFEPATGHWRKQLRFADVQAVWESRPVGMFRGEQCMVLDDLGDRLHVGYLGHDGYKAAELGYWQVDRGVFELVVPRTEVSEILEERTEYARTGSWTNESGPLRPPAGAASQAGTASQAGQEWPSGPVYPVERRPDSAAYTIPTFPAPAPAPASGPAPGPGPALAPAAAPAPAPAARADHGEPAPYRPMPLPDDTTGVTLPIPAEAPLPLEAQALRAASAARRPRQTAAQRAAGGSSSGQHPPAGQQPSSGQQPPAGQQLRASPAAPAPAAPPARQRRTARPRLATERLFADLASLAGIPADSYSVGEEVDGALCLLQADGGFEVFHFAGGARHELQVFATEESACFYLFGLLTAEAVRNGSLARVPASRLA